MKNDESKSYIDRIKEIFNSTSALDVQKSWEDQPLKFNNMVEFQNWFDSCGSIEECIENAKLDWKLRFKQSKYFQEVHKGTCLEIGFGGGRLISQSSQDFKKAIGVDVHKNFAMTRKFLNSQGIDNYELVSRDDIDKIDSNSVDFIYSFIVFQHFELYQEVINYLQFIKRVLKKNGICQIYYGKSRTENKLRIVPKEKFKLRECSLFLEPHFFRSEIIRCGYDILEFKDDLVKNLKTMEGTSGQSMVIFKKSEDN